MDWTLVSYAYDGSFAGFLTCVFASYAHREEPMSFSTPEDGRISLWPERTVDTDEARAQRVYRSLAPRLGQEGRRLAGYGFLTCLEERELHLWRFLRLGYDRGPGVVRDLTDDRVAVLTRAVGHLTGEAHLLKGFTRFSEQEGVLVGEIAPKNRVLPLLRPHFCARYPEESFVLYDRTHREALFYAFAQARQPILEMRPKTATLEEVFLDLTDEDDAVAAQAAALLADTPDEAAVQTTDAEQEGTGDESDL